MCEYYFFLKMQEYIFTPPPHYYTSLYVNLTRRREQTFDVAIP